MDWQQKAQALAALADPMSFSLCLREDGSWYVRLGVERKEGGCLSSGCQNGKTPEEAIEQCWEWAIDPQFYLIKNACSDNRKAYKWTGFMWKEIEEREAVTPEQYAIDYLERHGMIPGNDFVPATATTVASRLYTEFMDDDLGMNPKSEAETKPEKNDLLPGWRVNPYTDDWFEGEL